MSNDNHIVSFLTKNKVILISIGIILIAVIILSVQFFAPNNFKIFKTVKSEISSSSSSDSTFSNSTPSTSSISTSNSSSSQTSSSKSSTSSAGSSKANSSVSTSIFPEDTNYAVITSSKCDLSIRYNKITNDKYYLANNGNFPMTGRLYDSENFLESSVPPIEAIRIQLDTIKLPNAATDNVPGFNINCYPINVDVQKINQELAKTELKLESSSVSKDNFCKGIFLTSVSCSKITNMQRYIRNGYGLEANTFFEYNNKKYLISNYSDVITPTGLSVHFTSLGKV